LKLRRIEKGDLPQLFEWRNHLGVRSWCRQYAPLHWADHEAWFEKQAADPKIEMFSLIEPHGDLVGVCGLTDIDLVNRRAEFSLYIGPTLQGFGFGLSGLKLLFTWGFGSLGLNRIFGETFDLNPAAKIFEKLGMEKEGTRRDFYYRNGRFIDAHLYSISAADFNRLYPGIGPI
jgi:RimJ/RimL family protein N-acetyltransferase